MNMNEINHELKRKIESDHFYKFLFDNVGDVIWVVDMDLNILYISESVKMWDRDAQEVIGTNCGGRFSEDTMNKLMDHINYEISLDINDPEIDLNRFVTIEYEVPNGKDPNFLHQVEGICTGFRNSNNELIGFFGVSRDITHLKTRQQIEKEKLEMEVMMKLVTKLHNRLSQPLQALFGYCDLLAGRVDDEKSKQYVSKMQKAKEEIQELFVQMRKFDTDSLTFLEDKSKL